MVSVLVISHKIEWICMALRILNLEGNQGCVIGSKFMTILATFFDKGLELVGGGSVTNGAYPV